MFIGSSRNSRSWLLAMVTPEVVDTLFRMLADPTRRRLLDVLVERGERTVSELAAEFPQLVTSGISKHLMGLRAAGLVHATRQGRQQVYRAEAGVVTSALAPWLAKYEQYWGGALERLRDLTEGSEAGVSGSGPGRSEQGAGRRTKPRTVARGKVGRGRGQQKRRQSARR
jgi:DNA-binding transcriptional ArsR family regulator